MSTKIFSLNIIYKKFILYLILDIQNVKYAISYYAGSFSRLTATAPSQREPELKRRFDKPSSGRKGDRPAVEGACVITNKCFLIYAFSLSRLRRQLPPGGSLLRKNILC